jgi:hypothetical protein
LLMRFADQKLIFEDVDNNKKWEFTVAGYIVQNLELDKIELENKLYQRAIEITSAEISNNRIPNSQFYLSYPDPEINNLAAGLILNKYELSNWDKVKIKVNTEDDHLIDAVTVALHALRLRFLEKIYERLLDELKAANPDDMLVIMTQQRKIQIKINRLSEEMARIILR